HRGEAFGDAPGRAAGCGLRGGHHHHPRKEARAGKGDDSPRIDELKVKRSPCGPSARKWAALRQPVRAGRPESVQPRGWQAYERGKKRGDESPKGSEKPNEMVRAERLSRPSPQLHFGFGEQGN